MKPVPDKFSAGDSHGKFEAEENEESACEELTQCAYSKIVSVIVNRNSA
jgi:hypothetical protein